MASVSQTLHCPVEMPAWGSTSRAGFSHLVIPVLSHPSYETAFCTELQPQLGLEKFITEVLIPADKTELISSYTENIPLLVKSETSPQVE